METRHINSKLDCYQLLKILEELVEKDGLFLSDICIGVDIDNDDFHAFGVSSGVKLIKFEDTYLLQFCCRE